MTLRDKIIAILRPGCDDACASTYADQIMALLTDKELESDIATLTGGIMGKCGTKKPKK